MIRSGTIHTIHELATQGKSIHAIARELGIARNTVRRYLRGKPEAVPRPRRGSKLDAYKGQIHRWINEDHLLNCEVMLPRLQTMGYTGSAATLRAYVQTLRPRNVGRMPVIRYETKPGEQMQYDWGEFHYEQEGKDRKFYGFTAVLGYSRMRFVTFVKRCDTATMLRCMIEAFDYFGGLPKAALTDRMKSVFLDDLDGETPRWNPLFADFMATLGVAPRVCRPRKPQTKGKVERTVEVIKYGFWPGVHFTDLDDLNEQATAWCNRLNQKVHYTTRRIPLDLWVEEQLTPLPKDTTWERFGAEERRVSADGFVSFDGVLYGLPSTPAMAGALVQIRKRQRELRVMYQGKVVATHQVRARSTEIVVHPQQFAGVPPTPSLRQQRRHIVEDSLPLEQIPPLVFSEVMRDVDLFVCVASVGNDPTWQDGGQGRYHDYWHAYSLGELSATAETRRNLLSRLLPRLTIADRCILDGRFLKVRGDLRTYKIHLGSGNILMEPNDQYLCIVPRSVSTASSTPGFFLPFEGDMVLSIILSKAFLLAKDTAITDPSIMRQIGTLKKVMV